MALLPVAATLNGNFNFFFSFASTQVCFAQKDLAKLFTFSPQFALA